MIVLGLTGSIGMGKTTTAAMFADAGAAIFSADEVVHRMYRQGGAAVEPIGRTFPGVVREGQVDRARLAEELQADPSAFASLEAIVHPLVAQERMAALGRAREEGVELAMLEIPLLFETGADRTVDASVVVTASAEVQRERVLGRYGMNQAKFELLLSRQLGDGEKRALADFTIDTGRGLVEARRQVGLVIRTVLDPGWRSRREIASALDVESEAAHLNSDGA